MKTTIHQFSKKAASSSQEGAVQRKTQASGSRTYIIPNGNEYPSITTILGIINKPVLVPWAAKMERLLVSDAAADLFEYMVITNPKMSRLAYMHALELQVGTKKKYQKELEKASGIGTEVHNKIEWMLRKKKGETVEPEPLLSCDAARHAFGTFETFQKEHELKPLFLEKILWSDTYRCAGTTDWIALFDQYIMIGDWKTGKAIYQESFLQVSAYVFLAIEMKLISPPVKACIIRLPKLPTDPKAEIKILEWEEVQEHFHKGFLPARDLFGWQQAQKKK